MTSLLKSSRKRVDAETSLLSGMIYSDKFLQTIAAVPDVRELILTPPARTVADWSLAYWRRYEKAPRGTIREIYGSAVATGAHDEDLLSMVDAFLDRLPDDEGQNWDYLLDQSIQHLRIRKAEVLRDRLSAAVLAEDPAQAEDLIATYARVERETVDGFSLLRDGERVRELFLQDDDDELFTLPGAMGQLVGPLCRGDLVAFASPAKRGKSWWLQETAIRAMLAKKVVVFYSLEMSERQMLLRIHQNLCAECRPSAEPRTIKLPRFTDDGEIEQDERIKTGLTLDKIEAKRKALVGHIGRGDLHLVCYPAYTANVKTIRSHLARLEQEEGIIPDVVVVDYADILAPEIKADYRHQIDHTWKGLRALAQERHCLVLTASHTNKATFDKDAKQGDVSEDIRKINHVSTMISLNQTPAEKEQGVMRAVALAQRHESFSTAQEVVILHNLSIAKPYLDSRWRDEIPYERLFPKGGRRRDNREEGSE